MAKVVYKSDKSNCIATIITMANKLVLSILFSTAPTTIVASSMLNNIVETVMNNIVRSTSLFTHDI